MGRGSGRGSGGGQAKLAKKDAATTPGAAQPPLSSTAHDSDCAGREDVQDLRAQNSANDLAEAAAKSAGGGEFAAADVSIKELFVSIDGVFGKSSGQITKEKMTAWLESLQPEVLSDSSAHSVPIGKESFEHILKDVILHFEHKGAESLVYSAFQRKLRKAQESELQRFYLSLGIHKLLAEASLRDELIPFAALREDPSRVLDIIQKTTPHIIQSVQDGLDERIVDRKNHHKEEKLRSIATVALGVDEMKEQDAGMELKGLQKEYSTLLRKRVSILEVVARQQAVHVVCKHLSVCAESARMKMFLNTFLLPRSVIC